MLGNLVLQHKDNLRKALQSSDLSAAEGQELASLCIETITRIRTQESLHFFGKRWKALLVGLIVVKQFCLTEKKKRT